VTRDPIDYAGGPNLYEYIGNTPLNENDPDGLDPPTVSPIKPPGKIPNPGPGIPPRTNPKPPSGRPVVRPKPPRPPMVDPGKFPKGPTAGSMCGRCLGAIGIVLLSPTTCGSTDEVSSMYKGDFETCHLIASEGCKKKKYGRYKGIFPEGECTYVCSDGKHYKRDVKCKPAQGNPDCEMTHEFWVGSIR
jgi:hypothetical protein